MDDDKYIYKAFPLDGGHGMWSYRDSHFITVTMHTMAGPFDVQWEIVRNDQTMNQIVARRLKREGEK